MAKMKNKKPKKVATYNLTYEQMEGIKKKATTEAINFAFKQMILISMMVLRDYYGFGAKRLEDFAEYSSGMLDSYNKGYLSLDDMQQTIKEETGIKIIRK
ncbi:hypothetical protein KQI68_07090 [Peptoniphilus sp. MSJ-1]|uniref:Uncharacterized protein n=1 Tax=Peptoniphilus ovalis TaxID=2841503 RepID=A0ABS6FHT4_9FIRM|nr:hypothetical protein [Peptoniphilus ovalis]MBU5669603.1 hypothetical protein [Peptoniphilus ovalis]